MTVQQPKNPEVAGLIVGVALTAAGALAALLPFVVEMDMMGEGYALVFIGGFVALIGLVTAWVFRGRVLAVQRLWAGSDLLAHWCYDTAAGEQLVEDQYAEYRSHNTALYFVVAAFILVIGGACLGLTYLTEGEVLWPMAYVFLSLLVLLGAVAFLAPQIERRRAQHAARDVYIGRQGMIVQGALHAWGTALEQLAQVEYTTTAQGPELCFTIRSLSSVGALHYTSRTVRVPVPPGQEQSAQAVVQHFQALAAARA